MTRIGIFTLRDAPDQAAVDLIRDALTKIDYPWRRIIPSIRDDPDRGVVVRFDPKMQQGATGTFHGGTYTIAMGTRYSTWRNNAQFVFAHECGHLVDRATLGMHERDEIMDLFHDSPETYRRDEERVNGEVIEYAHAQDHNKGWVSYFGSGSHYYLQHNESYADAFVAAFAPDLFSDMRFTHWTSDFAKIREITLRKDIQVFDDVPEDHPFREEIEWMAEQGISTGYKDGTFRPDKPITRQAMAAMLYRLNQNQNQPST